MIAQRRRRDGKLEFAFLGKEVNRLFRDRCLDRRFFLESRKKFAHGAGIKQRAREAMLADLAGLLEHVDILFAELRVGMARVVLIDELREAKSTRHAGRAAANDDDVGRHLGAFDVGSGLRKISIQVSKLQGYKVSRSNLRATEPLVSGYSLDFPQWLSCETT